MEGARQIMSVGIPQSIAPAVSAEAPKMRMAGGEVKGRAVHEAVKHEKGKDEEREAVSTSILESAKGEGYDAAFEKMASGDFGQEIQEEPEEVESENDSEDIENRVEVLERQVLKLSADSARMTEYMKRFPELLGLTYEELLALALILKKKLEKDEDEEDKGLLDALLAIIGKLFQSMADPGVIIGEEPEKRAA